MECNMHFQLYTYLGNLLVHDYKFRAFEAGMRAHLDR